MWSGHLRDFRLSVAARMMTRQTGDWYSQPVYTYTYYKIYLHDIKRQVGKTPPISILMSGKTFYRL